MDRYFYIKKYLAQSSLLYIVIMGYGIPQEEFTPKLDPFHSPCEDPGLLFEVVVVLVILLFVCELDSRLEGRCRGLNN